MLGFHQTCSHIVSYRYQDIWHEYRDMKFCPYRSALVPTGWKTPCVLGAIWLSFVVLFFGWRSPVLQLFVSFCFRSCCPIGRLGGGVGATAHCMAGPASSLLFVLFGQGLQPSFVCSWIYF